jgi:outer membrane lipase/esterase
MSGQRFAAALLSAIVLTSCGGGDLRLEASKPQISALVSFGDSLSDIGAYSVGTVKALGGGKYTVNAPESKNRIELIAARFGLPAPCPAQTGLDGVRYTDFFGHSCLVNFTNGRIYEAI